MKRRKFILLGAATLLLSFTAGSIYFISFDYVVKLILNRKLGSTGIDPDVIDQFLAEAKKLNHWSKFSKSKKILISGHALFHGISTLLPFNSKFRQYSDEIIGDFMLGTNYFYSKDRSFENLQYFGIRNLYLSPCSHPFSNMYFSNS